MSDSRAGLERLCAHCGIATAYHDIWGNWREVSEPSLRALLGEFGIDAGTPERAAKAEGALNASRRRETLAPTLAIAEHSAPWRIRIRIPAAWRALRWQIAEEGGGIHEQAFDPSMLRETGRDEVEGMWYCERELEIGVALPPGYHHLRLEGEDGPAGEALVIAAPQRCYLPEALSGDGRVWGPAIQLYALRSERNWGIGDFSDLAQLVGDWAALGAGIIGLGPLHALFPHAPADASPYSPSSRERLNVLYLDVEAIAEFTECDEAQHLVRSPSFQTRLARLREAPLVDYAGVAAAKFAVLERLYAHFRARHLAADSAPARAFREFQARSGGALRRHALFEALQARFHAEHATVHGWQDWPAQYRDPDAAALARLASEHLERVEFYEYLQWQAERQLTQVGERCAALRLAVGLYLDLAVSVHRGGSDAWANPRGYALGASVGAPADDFSPQGQDWGLPPLRPDRLRAQHYAALRAALVQNMRAAGALRIDHVMGLMRLFWVPPGGNARDGAYVHYNLDEQLAIVALESHRNRCMVIGEDLGTVPDEVREKLARAGALSCRLLYFERRHDGGFKANGEYPRDALVAVSTHDLPTLAGWWEGRDLRLWRELGMLPGDDATEKRLLERAQARLRLTQALQRAGLLAPETSPEEAASQALSPALAEAIHAFMAAAPSRVMMVQIEDALGVTEQANLPGTTVEHPNWRRKLPDSAARVRTDARVIALANRLSAVQRG